MRESILVAAARRRSLVLVAASPAPGLPVVTGTAAEVLAPDASAQTVAEAAARLARERGLAAQRVVLALDAAEAAVRRLPFPFTAPGKIDLVLGPEFEPFLAAPPDETALAWSMTALAAPPEAVVLAAAVPRPSLVASLDALAASGLAPQAACLDLAGLDALLGELLPHAKGLLCVLLEDGRADFVCRLDGAPLSWRTLAVPADDAAATAAFLVREAVLSLSAMASRPAEELTLVLGGEARDPALAGPLEAALGTPGLALPSLAGWPALPSGEPLPEAFARAYGLAALAVNGAGPANFLRGALAPPIPKAAVRRALLLAGGSGLVLAACAVGALAAAYWRLDAAINRSLAQTEAVMTEAAPDLAPGLTPAQKLSALRGRLAERAAAKRDQEAGPSGGALELLAAIHQGLGPGGAVQARRVALDETRATIDAVADDYTTVDAVKRRLAGMPFFSSVDIRGAKSNPDKKQVEFQLDLKLAGTREQAP